MKISFKYLKNDYKNTEEKFTNFLKKQGFTEGDIKEIFSLYKLEEDIIYKNNDYKIYGENGLESYDNGFSNGLYEGAKEQSKYIITKLIDNKIEIINKKGLITEDNHILHSMLKELYITKQALRLVFGYEDKYDINIALKSQYVYSDCEEDYYIIIQKNVDDKKYRLSKLEHNKVIERYKPLKEELEDIEKAINELD